jgi:hypothetical protein
VFRFETSDLIRRSVPRGSIVSSERNVPFGSCILNESSVPTSMW